MSPRRSARRVAAQHGSRGFSLIELMVAIVVSAIVLVGVFAFSGISRHTSSEFRRGIRVNRALEGAMHAMGNDVRIAGLGFARHLRDRIRVLGVRDTQSRQEQRRCE